MGWANDAFACLIEGKEAVVRPLGGSMRGRIESGQQVTIAPIADRELAVGDAVFVRWKRGFLLHLIKEIDGDRVLIGNNLGKVNGWASRRDVLGVVVTPAARRRGY